MTDYERSLSFRSDFLQSARYFLIDRDFLEIHTPKISFIPTDQNDHLFKVGFFGTEAYLVQSPQFYKQAYVINGMKSVFEIAPVFRAETRITKEHLSEFLSLDIESSRFRKLSDIIEFEIELLRHVTKSLSSVYNSRKIDTFEIIEHNTLKKLMPGINEAEVPKHFNVDGVFIVNYPAEERAFYYDDEGDVSLSFDLIVDGLEITSGGMRAISREKLIEKMRKSKIEIARYLPYLELFNKNTPPHGGFAVGIDRIISKCLGINDIAEVDPLSKKPSATGESLKWKQ